MTKSANTPQTTNDDKKWYKNGKEGTYICVPIDTVLDRNLKFEPLKVLLALAKHADKNGMCWPGRSWLAEMTGIHPVNVSKATRTLAELGWLTKQRRNGRSSIYYLMVPGSSPITKQNQWNDGNATQQGNGFDIDQ